MTPQCWGLGQGLEGEAGAKGTFGSPVSIHAMLVVHTCRSGSNKYHVIFCNRKGTEDEVAVFVLMHSPPS